MAENSPHTFSRRLGAAAAWYLAAWMAFTFAFTPLRSSTDEFWHLKTGQWIVQHGALPKNDIFSYTSKDLPWNNHEWLSEVVMWKLYAAGEASGLGGWRTVIAWKTLFIIMAFAGLAWAAVRRRTDAVWGALAAVIAAALARRTFYPRPPFITYLLIAVLLSLLIEWRAGRLRTRWLWLLPALFALWSNLHGGWLAGLVVCGAFWADQAWIAWRTREAAPRRQLLLLTLIGCACLLGTFLNPYGYHLYQLAGRVMSDPYLVGQIGEMLMPPIYFMRIIPGVFTTVALCAAIMWLAPEREAPATNDGDSGGLTEVSAKSPAPRALRACLAMLSIALTLAIPAIFYMLARQQNFEKGSAVGLGITIPCILVSCLAVGLALLRLRPAGALAHALLCFFFIYEAILHVRHVSLLGVAIVPTLAWSLGGAAQAWPWRAWRCGALAAGWATLLGLSGWWTFAHLEDFSFFERNQMLFSGVEMQPLVHHTQSSPPAIASTLPGGVYLIDPYPVKALDFMLQAKLPGPIWNMSGVSGYLIWRLAPEHYLLFSDNRYDIFGGRFVRQENAVAAGWTAEMLAQNKNATAAKGFYPWYEVLDRWNVQTVLIAPDEPGNVALKESGKWTRVWEDFQMNLWVRQSPENAAIIKRALAMPHARPWLRRLDG